MPWAGGTYTVPPGTTVVANTDILAAWANTLTNDLQVGINACLNRDGSNNMAAPFPNFDGTQSLPGITFGSELSTGWYRESAGQVRLGILTERHSRMLMDTGSALMTLWDDNASAWVQVLDTYKDFTIDGSWTFDNATTFANSVVVEDGANAERTVAADVSFSVFGDVVAPLQGQTFFILGQWISGPDEYRRRYEIKQTNVAAGDGDFQLRAFEDDGTTLRDQFFEYERVAQRVQFNTDVIFGQSGTPNAHTIVLRDTLIAAENAQFGTDDGQIATVFGRFFLNGQTNTEGFSPASARAEQGLDSLDSVRVMIDGVGQRGFRLGQEAAAPFGTYVAGDFVESYSLLLDVASSDLLLRSWNGLAEAYEPDVFRFHREAAAADSTLRFNYESRFNSPAGRGGEGLYIQDESGAQKLAGYRRPTQTVVSGAFTIDKENENQVIDVDTGGITVTCGTDWADGMWVQVVNSTTSNITLNAGAPKNFRIYTGNGTLAGALTVTLRGGGAVTLYKRTGNFIGIFGAGII